MIGIEGTYALNGGRGRATPQCVWSIHRIDAQLGRLLDINSAWRDPQEQERLYTAYRNYVNGNGPWAPIALPPEQSVHCKGEAIDTDDNNAAMTRILNDNGWFHTVFRNGVLVEPWHYEYDYKRDKYFGGTPAGGGSTPLPVPKEWDEMASKQEIKDAVSEVLSDSWMQHENASLIVIITYASNTWRNGKHIAGPGWFHTFTPEEWEFFTWYKSANGQRFLKDIPTFTPPTDRAFDVTRDFYLSMAPAPKA